MIWLKVFFTATVLAFALLSLAVASPMFSRAERVAHVGLAVAGFAMLVSVLALVWGLPT